MYVGREVNGVWNGQKMGRGNLQALVFLEVSRLEGLRDIVRVLGSGKGNEGDECG
jgi:hypothetical protein